MNDLEFLNYVEAHSETPRALFSVEHVKRLFTLAKGSYPKELDEEGLDLIRIREHHALPLTEEARRKLKEKVE